jgi:hypothetical protein
MDLNASSVDLAQVKLTTNGLKMGQPGKSKNRSFADSQDDMIVDFCCHSEERSDEEFQIRRPPWALTD